MSAPEREPWGLRIGRRFLFEGLFAILIALLFADYLFSSKILYGSDSVPGGVAFRTLNVEFVKMFHEFPKWNPYILGGLPYLDATHGDTFFPSSILHFLFPVYRGMGHKLLLHIVLAGVFMMFYLRSLRLRREAVVWGGLTYMLSPVFVSYLFAGQDGKMYVVSLTPLVMGLLERGMRSGNVRTFLGLGLAIGVTVLSAQIQMAYHMLWLVGALFVLRLVKPAGAPEADVPLPSSPPPSPPRFKTAFLFAAALGIGLLVAAIQLLPAVTYVKNPAGFSVRSEKTDYEHATSWSLHPEEILSMVVPEFCNAPHGYWGRNYFKYNSDAVGILTLFLAGLALAARRDATRVFYGAMAAFAVLYSLGGHTPLHRLFYSFVPQVKLFRAPPLVMFIGAFSFVVLAAHAVNDWMGAATEKGKGKSGARASKAAVVGFGIAGFLVLVALGATGFTSFWTDLFLPGLDAAKRQAQAANLPAFRTGAFVAALVLAAGVATIEGKRRGLLTARTAILLLAAIAIGDLWRIDRRFKVVLDERQFLVPDALVASVRDPVNSDKYRVMPANQRYAMNELGLFGVESTLGFHDNELSWYRELRMAPESEGLLKATEAGYPFLRMLNVKYILHDIPNVENPYVLPGFLPRFRIVDTYEVVDRSKIAARIADPAFDIAKSVVLEEAPAFPSAEVAGAAADSGTASPSAAAEAGRVLSYKYDGNEIHVDVEAARPCLLVHSENWFPYWKATEMANGEGQGGDPAGSNRGEGARELPILRANGAIRAIPLEAGAHSITLKYRSEPYERGKWITLGTVGLLAAAIVFSRRRSSRPS